MALAGLTSQSSHQDDVRQLVFNYCMSSHLIYSSFLISPFSILMPDRPLAHFVGYEALSKQSASNINCTNVIHPSITSMTSLTSIPLPYLPCKRPNSQLSAAPPSSNLSSSSNISSGYEAKNQPKTKKNSILPGHYQGMSKNKKHAINHMYNHHLLIAAVAPALAKSLLTLRVATLGSPLPIAAPALVRLLPSGGALIFEMRLVAALMGLVPARTAGASLKLAGGSGSGRLELVVVRLTGESLRGAVREMGGFWGLRPVMNSWRAASSGFMRRSGSHLRHLVRKSRNDSSSHLRTWVKVLVEGRLLRPLEETVRRGLPAESKKSLRRVDFSIRCFSGGPKTSMMQASCSCSFSPGKMGTPVRSSARMQPRDHMSMGMP